ncbi:regulatory protein, luxR family [Phyllobacterium sp. CL33Tsu]|uniref:helix-turn-helix transcriptional regulator n=1 Tax=Phyllobacterium TaxID=28100 RepID=UPI0008EE018B|nr:MULTISPECIES: response regulator transcription factor [unclassified Phyllobacterium]UGY10721.1 response regulator transcription factor [Phyllobacterium sp. T1018]SFI60126.1 regulatory protein, luxR family [Phyllobacterium sp. CL33Tsu]
MSATISHTRSDHVHHGAKNEDGSKFRNGIFIYAEAGVVFQGLVQSLERTFPDLKIRLSSKLNETEESDENTGLVLIHAGFAFDLADSVERCKHRFPHASITLMIDENSTGIHEYNTLFDSKQVQGLLPFSLKLDIWLAVVWLLLNGGEYYPSTIVRSMEKTAPAKSQGANGQAKSAAGPMKSLTIREHQILELLSEGLQNKIIADRLALSEHTVKVHVHNLIRKLRVHNRTQAAAIYRDSIDQEEARPPFRGYSAPLQHPQSTYVMSQAV